MKLSQKEGTCMYSWSSIAASSTCADLTKLGWKIFIPKHDKIVKKKKIKV